MAKSRGNREGSIVQRKDGRWMARVTVPDGGRKAYYGRTRHEAADKCQGRREIVPAGRRETVPLNAAV